MAKTLVSQHNIAYQAIRASAALTTDYVSSEGILIEGCNQVQLAVSFTLGSSEGALIKVETSWDGTTYYQESGITLDWANAYILTKNVVRKLSTSGNYVISLPVSGRWIRISAKALTTGTGTAMAILLSKANI